MKCCIATDLLPGYIDGLTSPETNEEIEKHLESCDACNTIYRQMTAVIASEISEKEHEVDFLKKLKGRMHRKFAAVSLATCAVLIGTTVFLQKYTIPVPYDPDCMTMERYEIAYVPNSFGLREWQYKSDAAESENSGEDTSMEKIRFVLNLPIEKQKALKINNFTSRSRTIQRDGKTVRIVYYCYTRTLWNSLFPDDSQALNSLINEGDIYEESFGRNANEDYQPIPREIYYLPMRNLDKLNRLSDEEFDAQKEAARLVWSGVI